MIGIVGANNNDYILLLIEEKIFSILPFLTRSFIFSQTYLRTPLSGSQIICILFTEFLTIKQYISTVKNVSCVYLRNTHTIDLSQKFCTMCRPLRHDIFSIPNGPQVIIARQKKNRRKDEERQKNRKLCVGRSITLYLLSERRTLICEW